MRAHSGDQIVIPGHHVGDPERRGVVLETRGDGGQPPYIVQWSDGREDLFIPSSDAVLQPRSAPEDEA